MWPLAVGFMHFYQIVFEWEHFEKKVFNFFSELGRKMWFSEKCQKLLYFDKALWPNHLTYSKLLGISGKTMSISFIWYPGIWNLSSHWVTVALWKWWPLKGSGRKWVIRPYPLACPWYIFLEQRKKESDFSPCSNKFSCQCSKSKIVCSHATDILQLLVIR